MYKPNRSNSNIINNSPLPTFVIDREHKVTHWNKACEALTGVPTSAIVGTSNQWTPFYHHPRKVLADLIVDQANENSMHHYYAGGVRKSTLIDGAYEAEAHWQTEGKWICLTAAALKNASGEIVGAIQILTRLSSAIKFSSPENER